MQEIIFDETQLDDLQAVAADLLAEDATDPRSWNYKRTLIRPKIPWTRMFCFAVFLALGTTGCYSLLVACSIPKLYAAGTCLAGVFVVLLLLLKGIFITLIQIYQRFAPASIRNKCRFEPSCSEYMILAVQKYGMWAGLKKGVDRLKRCNLNDGGFDYP